MAALNAADARREARALRAESERLRREAHAQVGATRRRLHVCLRAYARTGQLASSPRPSPWSTLPWQPVVDELDRVLVPL